MLNLIKDFLTSCVITTVFFVGGISLFTFAVSVIPILMYMWGGNHA